MWSESSQSLVQTAMQALNTIPMEHQNECYFECYFAYRVITYLGKEIVIHGTPPQKEHILHLMKSVSYEWDENNQVFSSDRSGYLHLTTSAVWSDEIADIVDETFQIRAEINMTPLLDRMTYELIFDVAPAIILYGNEEQLVRLSTFIDECS